MRPTINTKFYLVIPAGGIGKRFGSQVPKQYLKLANGLTVLDTALKTLLSIKQISACVLVLNKNDTYFKHSIFFNHSKIITAIGGKRRQHSTFNALKILKSHLKDSDKVLVHDAVRPCIDSAYVLKLMQSTHPVGAILASPINSTLKRVENNIIKKTVDRNCFFQAQTPQIFYFGLLFNALENVIKTKIIITDDAHALELLGHYPQIVIASKNNIKITHPEDIQRANLILNAKQ